MAYELVKIFTAQDNLQAEMILEALKENDIPAMKKDLGNAEVLNLAGGAHRNGAGRTLMVWKRKLGSRTNCRGIRGNV